MTLSITSLVVAYVNVILVARPVNFHSLQEQLEVRELRLAVDAKHV
jgi:hypothetical protein